MLDNYQSQHRRVDIVPIPFPTSPPPNNRQRVQNTTDKSDSPDLESLRAAVLRSKVILTRVPEIKDQTLEEGQESVHARIVGLPLDKKEEKDTSLEKENNTRSSENEGEEALRQAVLLTLRKKSAAAKSIPTPVTTEVGIKPPTSPVTLSSVPPLMSFHQQIIIPLSNQKSGGPSDDPSSSLASRKIPSPLESPNTNPLNDHHSHLIHSPSGKNTIQDTIAMMKRQIAEKEKQRAGDNIPPLKDMGLQSSPSDSGDEIIMPPLELTTNHSAIGLKKIQELEDRKKELQAGVEKIEMEIASRLMTPTEALS